MTYSIFCVGVAIPVKCESMAAAIDAACKLLKDGANVCRINGSDGFTMERRDIEIECLRRSACEPSERVP